MIADGIVFGMAISLGYILVHWLTGGNEVMARTSSFLITLLSPQLYVFMLRDGGLIKKFTAPNKLLKLFFIFTILMILGIAYIPSLNALFKTAPIEDARIWLIIISFSLMTSLFRSMLDRVLKKEYNVEECLE